MDLSQFESSYYYAVRLTSQVDVLETEQKEKENYIQKLLLDLSQTQKEFKRLQETASKTPITVVMLNIQLIKLTMSYDLMHI